MRFGCRQNAGNKDIWKMILLFHTEQGHKDRFQREEMCLHHWTNLGQCSSTGVPRDGVKSVIE